MTIKQHGGVFGRNPAFNKVTLSELVGLTGGTGVTYSSNNEIAIGQDVGTTADPTFSDMTLDTLSINTASDLYSAELNMEGAMSMGKNYKKHFGSVSLTDETAVTFVTIDCTVGQASKGGYAFFKIYGVLVNGLNAASPNGTIQAFESFGAIGSSNTGGTSVNISTAYNSRVSPGGTARVFADQPPITASISGQEVQLQAEMDVTGIINNPRIDFTLEVFYNTYADTPTIS